MRILFAATAATLALATTTLAQEPEAPAPSPGEIVNAAPQDEWVVIDPEDLVVMTLPPLADGSERKVVMQLIGEPFSQGWVENIRTLARSEYWDGSEILRVQDNYVVQWGRPDPEMGVEPKPVPEGLNVMPESEYVANRTREQARALRDSSALFHARAGDRFNEFCEGDGELKPGWNIRKCSGFNLSLADVHGMISVGFEQGWPIGATINWDQVWPVHCYGMVGVGRGMSPDTGDGSQLYTVIGHAPRHLDRNIAVVGRIVDGIEHLSSLPRGKGALGFYEDPAKRVPIVSVRMAAELPASEMPRFEYLSTESDSFAAYADARANRRDPFFIQPAGGADICNIPVPVRRAGERQ
ncbi:peptidylprolyl isomerase [Alteriqipengyuania lutimaris]|uniref:Peptidylprolyl isomerase n=1 Tax=Alteriqipengyuania lutimaris TaxID=1538146 RepID=A0A395LNF5_9SPHN|nr:peptidylprolyl isomerase [Alteriqipengyuania lutimaris]MBB3035017.1 peptidylprolyl isomerase [Alteriqipengyuania lutimaris]RDS76170.1 peptidylprolyl isomerase [Alteriqipengyuania lutimaris]